MKLIFYINTLYGGGAERVMANLANRFVNDGFEVVLVTSYANTDDYELDNKVKRVVLADESLFKGNTLVRNIKLLLGLRRIIHCEKPDVAVSFMAEPNFRLLFLNPKGVKKVISMRNDPNHEYRGWRGKIIKKLFKRADSIVCQTTDALAWLPKQQQRAASVIMNQVAPVFMTTQHESEEYFVATGRLQGQKNYPMLINAFHRLLTKYPDEKLYIYGVGSLQESLQQQIDSLGRSENIVLKGATDNVPGVLSKAKCFVLSSDMEGMPNGLLEALAVGVPSVSTNCPCGGPRTVIDNEVNGLLVPIKNEDAMYDALLYMQEHPDERREMGKRAKESSIMFSPDAVYSKWKECIEGVVKK